MNVLHDTRGEIATIIAIGSLIIIGVGTIVTSVLMNQQTSLTTSSQASEQLVEICDNVPARSIECSESVTYKCSEDTSLWKSNCHTEDETQCSCDGKASKGDEDYCGEGGVCGEKGWCYEFSPVELANGKSKNLKKCMYRLDSSSGEQNTVTPPSEENPSSDQNQIACGKGSVDGCCVTADVPWGDKDGTWKVLCHPEGRCLSEKGIDATIGCCERLSLMLEGDRSNCTEGNPYLQNFFCMGSIRVSDNNLSRSQQGWGDMCMYIEPAVYGTDSDGSSGESSSVGECSNWCATPEQCAESNGRRVPRPCDYDSCAEGTFACKVDDASSGGGSSDEGSPGGSGSSPPPSSCPSGQLSCTNSDKSHCENNWCGNRDTPGCCAPDSGESPDEGSPGGSGDSSGGSSGENTSPGDENPPENNDEPDDPNPNDDEELPARPTGTPRATSTPRPSPTPTPEPKAKRILFTTESCSPRMRNWIPLSTSEQESDWIRTRGVTYENPHSDFSKIQFPQTAPLVSSCKGKKVVVEGTMYVNSNNSTKFKGTTICKEDATCPTDTPLQATTARFIFSVAANEMISDTSELGQHSIENDFTLTLQRNGANAEYTVPMDARDEWYKGEQELEISGGTYTIMIKHAQSLPVIFANISLDKGDVLNCTSGDSQSCGELQYWRSDDKKLIMGDVNGDELIDNNDKSLIVTYYLNNVPDINTEIYNADLNKDGVVDGKDLAIWRRGSREARE